MGHIHEHNSTDTAFRRVLWICLVLNFSMFIVDIIASHLSGSIALLADAIDFFSDSMSYIISLYVLNKSLKWRASAALINAGGMIVVGIWVGIAAIERFYNPVVPHAPIMGGVGAMALAVNIISAALLYKFRHGDSNAKSVWMCSRNDALYNVGIIVSAVLVYYTASGLPDLAIAALILVLELFSAWHVFQHAREDFKRAA